MHIKVTDFGTAKMPPAPNAPPEPAEATPRSNSFVGTAEYVPPELLNERSAVPESDLWSLGCVVYQLLAGRPPFKAGNEYQTFQKILKMDYKIPEGFPEDAADLVRRLLAENPEDRFGAGGNWAEIKGHPFFRGIPWGRLDSARPPEMRSGMPLEILTPRRTEDSQSELTSSSVNGNGNAPIAFEELEQLVVPIPPRVDSGMIGSTNIAVSPSSELGLATVSPISPQLAPPAEPARTVSLNSLTEDGTTESTNAAKLSVPIPRPVPPRGTSRPLTTPNGPTPPQALGLVLPQRPNTMLLSRHPGSRQPPLPAASSVVSLDPLASQRDPASPLYVFTLPLEPTEYILKHAPAVRRKTFFGLFSPPPRPLVLTTKPRLLAFRPDDHRRIKEQLDLSVDGTWCELLDEKKFAVRSPKGDWVLEDMGSGAQGWVDAVRRARAGV